MRKGKVIIAGAGPGDPDLITVKAVEALYSADVVIVDRLVSEVILQRYVPAAALIIYAGKEGHSQQSVSQQTINLQLVQYAREGNTVVRLKGGDVSVFSNVLDELQTLVAHHIPYEIVPGVTAAAGSAAYAGIPLTARGYASAVRFLTYYRTDCLTAPQMAELAATNDTLVFYMSVKNLAVLLDNLQQHGIAPDKKVAVIEQATTCFQQVTTASIYAYKEVLEKRKFLSPSLIIIGKVVNLHQDFSWLSNGSCEAYFAAAAAKKPILTTIKRLQHVV